MRRRILGLLAAVTLLSGCASIVSGHNQSLSVVANGEAGDVAGARCTLTNDKGEWFTTTPGTLTVHRSYSDLTVLCQHPSSDTSGNAQIKSSTKGMAFGNILFGGVIGVGVDVATGAAYDYPPLITVGMRGTASNSPPQSPPAAEPAVTTPAPPVASVQPAPPQADPVRTAAVPPTPQTVQQTAKILSAPVPVAATSVTPAAAPARPTISGGQDSFSAEKLARTTSCAAQPIATLVAKGPGFESYTVACSSGDALAIRCELGNCRVLQ